MSETLHPDRSLNLTSTQNIRDLGGYTTQDGSTTRWRQFIRSGDMDRLSEADQNRLVAYGINTVIDLRMQKEVASAPNVFTGSADVRFVIHDFWGTRFDHYRSRRKQVSSEEKLADLYCAGLIESGFVMADIMQTIADTPEPGFAFHCRSGKDRTGLVAALLLALANVPEETICADYALTERYLVSPEADKPLDPRQPGAYLRGCDVRTMQLTLAFLEDKFSGVAGYLKYLGLSNSQLARIREKLVA